MNLSSLFPHTIMTRLLDDLGAVAEAARRLPELERAVLARVDTMQRELSATRGAVEPLAGQLDRLEARLAPIEELPAVRAGVEALDGRLAPIEELPAVRAGVEALDGRLAPIEQLTPVRAAVEPLSDQLERLAEIVTPIRDIEEVRKGIEPLDEDMHAVRHSVDDLEPLMREVIDRLEALRADLSPLGELADKIPGIG